MNIATKGDFIRRLPCFGVAMAAAGMKVERRDLIRETKCLITGRSPSDSEGIMDSTTRLISVDKDLPGCFGNKLGIGHNSVQIPHDGILQAA